MLTCGICEERFFSNDDLRDHLEGHVPRLFDSDEEIEKNEIKIERDSDQESGEGSLILECVKEEEQLQGQHEEIQGEGSEASFSNERNRKSSSETFMCSKCSFKSNSKNEFKRHMNLMHLNKHKCEHCPKRYSTKGRLADHIRKEHLKDKPKLPEDAFFRVTMKKIGKRMEKHFECLKCTRQARKRSAIYLHIRSVHRKHLDELYKSEGIPLDDTGYHKCTQCSYKTLFLPHLRRHIETVHQKRSDFVCDLCKKAFPRKEYLLGHMKRIHIKDKSFSRAQMKHMHQLKHKCDHCPMRYSKAGYLANHVQKEHKEDDSLKMPEDEFLRVIMKKQGKQDRKHFECLKCAWQTSNRTAIYLHIRGVHRKLLDELYWAKGMVNDAGYHKCTKCPFKTLHLAGLREHIMVIHQKRQDYVCDLCKKSYSIKISLFHHMKNIHITNDSLFKCSICSYKAKYSHNLKEHLYRIHLNIREFTCDLCKRRFVAKRQMRKHIETAHKEKICKYDVRCSFRTMGKRNLTKHIQRVHLKMQGFSCKICGEWYSTSSGLYMHKKTHNPDIEKLFCKLTCDLCQTTTSNRNNMHKHMKTKHLKNYA